MVTPQDLERLKSQDPDFNYLHVNLPKSDTSASALSELARLLKNNKFVTRVRCFVQQSSFSAFDNEGQGTMLRLFQSIGSLPHLKQLKIDSLSGLMVFPVSVLTDTLGHACQLQELELWDLKLCVSSHDEVNDLQNSLHQHPSLQKFTLYNCQLLDKGNNRCSLDPILRALATIKSLKQVYITASDASSFASSAAFSASALEAVCQSQSLEKLGLWKFHCSPAHHYSPIIKMAPALATSKSMTMLEFGKCQLTPDADRALARMLSTNKSLEELDLHLQYDAHNNKYSGNSILAVAKTLGKGNTTLKRLKLWGMLSRQNQEALVNMLQHNYSLETCRLLDADRDIMARMDFYISLNRSGRQYLLQGEKTVTIEYWLHFLQRQDLSTIYYYLIVKPGLCCFKTG